MKRGLSVLLALSVVAAVAVGAWWWYQRDDAADADALPELTKPDATRAYLDGRGKVVTAMFDATPRVVDESGTCAQRVRRTLPPLGNPNALSAASAKVPDPTARDLALAHVGLLAQYAASCKGPEAETQQVGKQLVDNRASFGALLEGGDQ